MDENQIEREAYYEPGKESLELMKDAIREANSSVFHPAPEKENLDSIKHLLKRILIQQVVLEQRAGRTNLLLLILTIITTAFTVITFLHTIIR